MFNKKLTKALSACIASSMILGAGSLVLAKSPAISLTDGTDSSQAPVTGVTATADPNTSASPSPAPSTSPDPSASPEASPSASPDGTAPPSATPTPTDETKEMDIYINYYETDTLKDPNYVVDVMSKTLPEITDFELTVSFTNADISSNSDVSAELLEMGKSSQNIDNRKKVTLTYTLNDKKTPISGRHNLARLEVKKDSGTKFDKDTVKIEKLVATKADGGKLTVTPKLTFENKEALPEVSDDGKEVIKLVKALPSKTSISFYTTDSKLIGLATYTKQIKEASDAYDKLSNTEKSNVKINLDADGISVDTLFTSLNDTVTAMGETIGTLQIAYNLKQIEDNDALDYQFLVDTYMDDDFKDTNKKLTGATKAFQEFNDATSYIDSAKVKFDTAFSSASKSDKVASVKRQYDLYKKYGSDKYFSQYAEVMVDMIKEIDSSELDEILTKLATNYKEDLPSVEMQSTIGQGKTYDVKLTRKKTYPDIDAAEVIVRTYSSSGSKIAEKKGTFPKDSKKCTITMPYASGDGFTVGKKIYVKVTYIIDGITFELEDEPSATIYKNSSNNNTGTNGNGNGSYKPTTPTVYPTATPTPTSNPNGDNEIFTDIDTYDWAKEAIEGLYHVGIVNGMTEDTYNPAGNVTREQFAKMVVQLFNVPVSSADTTFGDVDTAAWYAPYISAAVNAGYIQGQSDEYFGIGESIMRQDMATILYRALGSTNDNKVDLTFADKDGIAPYAEDAIAELVGLGILNGYEDDNTFKPRNTATRAEAAKVIWGVYQLQNK